MCLSNLFELMEMLKNGVDACILVRVVMFEVYVSYADDWFWSGFDNPWICWDCTV
jgi:hypothetical protein